MSKLSEIEPKDKPNLIDLVKAAGVDVSDWANCDTAASRNPKYCYEWAFVEPNKVVILNLWYDRMEEKDGGIIMRKINMRKYADTVDNTDKMRALRFDAAIKTAVRDKLPIRVIVGIGKPPGNHDSVSKRLLDPVPWAPDYNWESGQCELIRGAHPENGSRIKNESAIDDLSDVPEGNNFPDRAKVIAHVIKRDNRVRAHALKRAKGRCEYCRVQGFRTTNGGFYVEAHHIIALCDSGRDTVDNVIALCPQHHRQAHYGKDAESLEAEFVIRLKDFNRR
jgi:5-methylcytosine-specific restriction protein A